jgi:hypothetical protein
LLALSLGADATITMKQPIPPTTAEDETHQVSTGAADAASAQRFLVPEVHAHPPSWQLDGLAAGDADAHASTHVAQCSACAAYVAGLKLEIEAAAHDFDPVQAAALHANLVTLAAVGAPQANADPAVGAAAASPALTLQALSAHPRWRSLRFAVAGLALAAGFAMYVAFRSSAWPSAQVVTLSSANVPANDPHGGDRLKGAFQVVIIRERAGVQVQLTGAVELQPNDRIRLQITTQGGEPIAAGVLSQAGEFYPLLAPEVLPAGTHFSQEAMRFDAAAFRGWVVWGAPDKIAALRLTHDVQSVQFAAIRVGP